MKRIKLYLTTIIVFALYWASISAQISSCQNIGFEFGDFTNWEGTTWKYSTEHPEMTTIPVNGIVHRRQTIISDTKAFDPVVGQDLKLIPPGYSYSCRLGDVITPNDALYTRCWHQNLRYTMEIDENNTLLILKFALVLEYIANHTTLEEPRFRFTVYDENGDTLPDCANFDIYASDKEMKGFNLINSPATKNEVMWRDWTTVGFNLSKYLGQTITVEFLTSDCTQTHHFGYGYFVAACQPLGITIHNCANDSIASLTAPEGFEKYIWKNNIGNIVDTLRVLNIENPVQGDQLYCTMTSATGCEVTINSTIAKFNPIANFGSYMIDCFSNTVQFSDSSYKTEGSSLIYSWLFEDGYTSTKKNPEHTFLTSGRHQVSLRLLNPPSSCTNTLTKEVESFSPPLVFIEGDSSYCPNDSIYLKAFGAYDYTWSTGSKEDSIKISDPGGTFWMLGYSSTGCVSDTLYETIEEDPQWELLTEGDTVICEGEDGSVLKAFGAVDYLWNTGETKDSIFVSSQGTYIITGLNKRGCKKTHIFNLYESPLPNANFTLLNYTLTSKQNILSGNISPNYQTDVEYIWNMGDGNFETGSSIQHDYNIDYNSNFYEIVVTAINNFGCENKSSDIVDIYPFVPNVFSPNGDGVNDVFMPAIDLHIFDRYGSVIFDGPEGWDGNYNGKPASPDTYFYSIIYINSRGKEYNIKGYLTLVR